MMEQANHSSVEPVDEERGGEQQLLDQARQGEQNDEGGGNNHGNGDHPHIDDDDDISVPPPPPPPMPPTMILGSVAMDTGLALDDDTERQEVVASMGTTKSKTTSKNKKIVLFAIVGIIVCAGIGLGLGFGLTSSSSSSSSSREDASNYSNQIDENVSTSSSDGATTTTSSTVAMTSSSSWVTDATVADINTNGNANNNDEQEDETTTTAATTSSSTGNIEKYDVIIIGAGWAGIRATETLLNEGITSLLVLEASDYIGGRARSFNGIDGSTNNADTIGSVNVPYDLGADWLYDNGNEMVAALTEGGYLDAIIGDDDDATTTSSVLLSTAQFYKVINRPNNNNNNNKTVLTTEVVEESDQWMEEVWNGFITYRENNLEELDGMSYQAAIDQYIDQFGWTDDVSLQLLNVIEDTMEYEYTADSSQLDIGEVEYYPPGFRINTRYMGVPGMGFGNLAAQYAEDALVREKTLLNSKVIEINSSSQEGDDNNDGFITVTYVSNNNNDGNGDGSDDTGTSKVVVEVQAKSVLVTVSLGVLKANTINFIPSLPDSKLESIRNMGFGTVNKCMMSWNNDDDLVWPEEEYWFLLLTPEEEEGEGNGETQPTQYSPWTTFFNPTKFKSKPALTAWLGGKEAIYAEENQTDDEILADVMTNLRAMFPTIRDPDRVVITRWGQDPNAFGAYSYPVPGRDFMEDIDNLSEAYGNIYFAGEATGSGWATTQGAWRTGEAAALSIAEMLLGGQ